LKNKASRWTLLGFTAFVDRRAHKVYLCCIDYPLKTKAPTMNCTPKVGQPSNDLGCFL
jgi:hypothetical protein